MQVQKSFDDETKGALYIVPTPIGNLEDITYRALNVLKTSSIIAAEDTRNTKKLLNHFDINTPLISYHEHNKEAREKEIIDRLEKGEKVALVSDAGMPAISDPGYELIHTSIQENLSVIVLPGANAALCSLVGSGLPTSEFLFYGFLPRKNKEKKSELERLTKVSSTIIFYESPYRIKATLQTLLEHLGDRKISMARELTKRFEEYVRGTISEILLWLDTNEPRGEYCIVVNGSNEVKEKEDDLWWGHLSVEDHVNYLITNERLSSQDAIKRVAKERKMTRREVYRIYHVE